MIAAIFLRTLLTPIIVAAILLLGQTQASAECAWVLWGHSVIDVRGLPTKVDDWLAVALLTAPAAYHRIVEAGENTERFHRVASVLILSALGPLALGIAIDVIVVVRKLTELLPVAIGAVLIVGSQEPRSTRGQ